MKSFVTVFNSFSLHLSLISLILLGGCSDVGKIPPNAIEHAVESAYTASISNDGKYSLVSSQHHGLSLWDIEQNALKYQWSQQDSENNHVLMTAIAPNNSHALSADLQNFVLWDIDTGKAAGFIKIDSGNIRDIAVSNNGERILIGKSDGKAVVIETLTGRRIEFIGHQEKINTVDISANGKFALTGSNDYVAYLWNTDTGQVVHRFNHPSRVTKVAFDQAKKYVFTADSQKHAQIWDVVTGKPVSRLQYLSRQNVFSTVRFNADSTLLATGAPTRQVALWDIKSGEKLQKWQVAKKRHKRSKGAVVHSVAFINNDKQLLTESSSGLAETWDIDK